VEAVLAAGAGVIYMRADTSFEFLSAILVFTLFLLIVVIDLEHRLILHAVTAPAGVMLILLALLDPERRMTSTLVGGAVGLGFFLLLYLGGGLFAKLMGRLRGEELEEVAFGFGDVTLAGLIGLTVGWPAVLPALLVGILAAGCFSLLFILATAAMGKYTPLTPIPYGPFLVLGALSVYFGALAPFPGVMQL
jgi:prepilin signal peptidase PulO-like enzyme (type II secretory pathway)